MGDVQNLRERLLDLNSLLCVVFADISQLDCFSKDEQVAAVKGASDFVADYIMPALGAINGDCAAPESPIPQPVRSMDMGDKPAGKVTDPCSPASGLDEVRIPVSGLVKFKGETYFSPSLAAKRAGVTASTVRRAIKAGILPAIPVTRPGSSLTRYLINKNDFRYFMLDGGFKR